MSSENYGKYQEYARKKLEGNLPKKDSDELMKWLDEDDEQPIEIPAKIAKDRELHEKRIYKKIKQHISGSNKNKGLWEWSSMAAAAMILIGFFIYHKNSNNKSLLATSHKDEATYVHVLSPGSNKAILYLSTGKQINLDSAGKGDIAQDGSANIKKASNGMIVYKTLANKKINSSSNTLTTTVGGRFQITLSDGTKVWLNAASSLTYPTDFSGKTRIVTMTGEAYFEVSHNPQKPFHVMVNGMDIRVLGTHFNINSYMDEGNVQATLLEGSICATKAQQCVFIKPGEQIRMNEIGKLTVEKNINTDKVTAWKNGKFDFGESSDIHVVMNQLARWYDFNVDYQKDFQAHVGGRISSNVDGMDILKMLEKTGSVHFIVKNKKISVMSP